MKKVIMSASVLAMFFTIQPVMADEMQHPAAKNTTMTMSQDDMQMDTAQMDKPLMQMQETREAMFAEMDPAKKENLMHKHQKSMRDAMNMMSMMDVKQHHMGQDETSAMSMEQRMTMMEKKMSMMGNMMKMHKGMMSVSPAAQDDERVQVMEKKMMMMQEMLNGMMLQQEMKIK